jgi:hypothetical protein
MATLRQSAGVTLARRLRLQLSAVAGVEGMTSPPSIIPPERLGRRDGGADHHGK